MSWLGPPASGPTDRRFGLFVWAGTEPTHPSLLLQIHEPVLTLSGSEELGPDCSACYAQLAAVGLPINVVVQFDDVPGKPGQGLLGCSPACLPA